MKSKTALLFCCLFISQLFFSQVFAQTINVSGKVTNRSTGEALSQATVSVKGTTTATQTDASGNFSINAPARSTLIVSFIGMASREVTVSPSATSINIELDALPNSMNEVVVVGYGTQKRSVVTGAISSVKARDLEKVPSNRIEQALQGRVSGVTIAQNSGQPGSPSTIRVRGITTFGDGGNNPLWVVDGVVVDQGGIAYLNQNDVESIEVLKDAASAAIYGTRAATGVILITTKKGRAGKFRVNYNGFYGTSSPAKKLDLLNAQQYATIMNERSVNDGGGLVFPDPASLGAGTDWQSAVFSNANRYSHEVSFSGGNERSTFYFSAGIQRQEGIVFPEISNYTRKNIRLNSEHKISKIFSFGQTIGYSHQQNMGIGNTNSEFGGPLSSAINLDPTTPLVITDPAVANAGLYLNKGIVRDANGNPYAISTRVGQEMTNPLAYVQTRLGRYGSSDDFVGNAYLEAAVPAGNIGNFKLRTTLGGKLAYWGGQGFTPIFYLSPTQNNIIRNNYNKNTNNSLNWTVENTLTYSNTIGDHDFTVLLGQGAYVEGIGGSTSATIYNLPINNYKDASFNFAIPQSDRESGTSDFVQHKLSSLFARVNYSYKEKYLFTGIIRRDGSNKFGSNKKYGIFHGVSAGWNVSNEEFWKGNNIVNRLKIRANYGEVGNDAILANWGYASIVSGGYNYTLGYPTQTIVTGYSPLTLDNPDLHWEATSQLDVGFEALLFNRLTLNFDVYKKRTTGILRDVNIPGYVGVSNLPAGNVADMNNSGVELELGYSKNFGQLNLTVNGNVTYLKNNVTYVARDTNFIGGDVGFQTMSTITRTQIENPYNAFFGYVTNGIFQNQAEIDAYRDKNGNVIQPNAKPGDFRWVDLNGDGKITNDNLDRTFLGSGFPKYTFGLTLNLDYKQFDLQIFMQGSAGNKIFQGLRRLDIGNANYQTKILGRWTGDGSTNEFPRVTAADPNGNYSRMSNYYLEKGDYTRMKLVTLGYSLPENLIRKIHASRLRVYITAENLFTITGYTGYDPEIGGMVLGVDRGVYPQARSILGGVQLQF